MKLLPVYLWRSLPKRERPRVLAWWENLSIEEQYEVKQLYRGQSLMSHREARQSPLRLVGMFIDGGEESLSHKQRLDFLMEDASKIPAYLSIYEANQADDAIAFWSLYEYASEEGFFLQKRIFHVCRAHKEARRVICEGLLPADFVCPLQNNECPMKQILCTSPGKALQLSLEPS